MIPPEIAAHLALLIAEIQSANPVENAPRAQIASLLASANTLMSGIEVALTAADAAVTTDDLTGDPDRDIGLLRKAGADLADLSTLLDVRGKVGRAALNLSQVA